MERESYDTYGRLVTCDVWGVDPDLLNEEDYMKWLIVKASEVAGATVLDVRGVSFDPQGVTAMAILQESHLSVHCYPEHGYASFDCYTCGEQVDPNVAMDYIINELKPTQVQRKLHIRGVLTK